MNILYIAYSCSPINGSEDKIGWHVPYNSSKFNKTYVITKEEQRASVEEYLKKHNVNNIQFFYVDIPAIYKKIFSNYFYSGRLNIWNKRAIKIAREICKQEKIDVIHQITPVEFRSIGCYGAIPNVKFVCGPIAGGQRIPNGLKSYAKSKFAVELVRRFINDWYRLVYILNGKIKKCDYLLLANHETKEYLASAIDENTEQHILTDISIDKLDLVETTESNQKMCSKCRFLVVGRLVYLKGHELLFDALKRIPKDLDYECYIVGDGVELNRLKRKCIEHGIAQKVTFIGTVPFTEITNVYKNADVFVMPSLREATGSVIMEAMAHGLPIVTINKYGAATILDDSMGWLYEGATKEEYIENLKTALVSCITQPDEVLRRGKNCRKNVERYTWDERIKHYNIIYKKLCNSNKLQ